MINCNSFSTLISFATPDVDILEESPVSFLIAFDNTYAYRVYTHKPYYECYKHHKDVDKLLERIGYGGGNLCPPTLNRASDLGDLLAQYDELLQSESLFDADLPDPLLPDVQNAIDTEYELEGWRYFGDMREPW